MDATPDTLYRSGAVARMVGLPVATLRVWERRYRLGAAAHTAAGHRLYSAADVQRIAWLKRLSELGHAIGAIAGLDLAALEAVAATHAGLRAGAAPGAPAAGPERSMRSQACRVVVVGAALADRLRRLQPAADGAGVLQRLDLVAVHDDLAQASQRFAGEGAPAADLLLVAAPTLHAEGAAALQALRRSWGAAPVGVVHGIGSAAARAAHRAAGLGLLSERLDDADLLAALLRLAGPVRPSEPPVAAALPVTAVVTATVAALADPPPRRYDDRTLADFAALSPSLACECPQHVAQLLIELGRFEAYSAECAHRDRADALLHQDLQRVAGQARALFEAALERLAIHEGWLGADGRPR